MGKKKEKVERQVLVAWNKCVIVRFLRCVGLGPGIAGIWCFFLVGESTRVQLSTNKRERKECQNGWFSWYLSKFGIGFLVYCVNMGTVSIW
jgi:hypothetical protein